MSHEVVERHVPDKQFQRWMEDLDMEGIAWISGIWCCDKKFRHSTKIVSDVCFPNSEHEWYKKLKIRNLR